MWQNWVRYWFDNYRYKHTIKDLVLDEVEVFIFFMKEIIKTIINKIPLKRDASGSFWSRGIFRYQWVVLRIVHCLVSMLMKLRQVVCGLTPQWSRGSIWILKNIMLLPFLDLKFEKYKISPRLVRILIDLAADHQREDTRHLNFPHTYRLITAYLLLRVNLDKIMHARWDFDASSARTRRVSALDKHQNWSASALFVWILEHKVNTQLLI